MYKILYRKHPLYFYIRYCYSLWKHFEFLSFRLFCSWNYFNLKRQVKSGVAETDDISWRDQWYIDKIKYIWFFIHMNTVYVPIDAIWFMLKNNRHIWQRKFSVTQQGRTSILLRSGEIYRNFVKTSLVRESLFRVEYRLNWIAQIDIWTLFF